MATLFRCIFGPRLFRRYKDTKAVPPIEGKDYNQNIMETTGDKFIRVMNFCWSLSCWTSPVLLTILYRRSYFTLEGAISLLKFALSLSVLYGTSFLLRGIGRYSNADYVTFISCLYNAQRTVSKQSKRVLSQYDFEFSFWLVDYDVRRQAGRPKNSRRQERFLGGDTTLASLPLNLISYVAIHTFGRRMVFPGATSLMNMVLGDALVQGRSRLVEEKQGLRAKVIADDGNEIDTMLIDRRGTKNSNGNFLVVCCEGNAGYYEIGCIGAPMEAGYSVLGWNHPGFGGSSGQPYPSTEENAIDAVMQYAINQLGFMPTSIILYAWSIGGYSAAWAAKEYPDVKFLFLDATFDDLIPLAISKMPQSWQGLVSGAIGRYMNLNISQQLSSYPGPICLVRRSRDEIITTECPPGMAPVLASNRGNFLLIQLLQHRSMAMPCLNKRTFHQLQDTARMYPKIVDKSTVPVLQEWLAREKPMQEMLWIEHQVNPDWCEVTLRSYVEQYSDSYPLDLGDSLGLNEKIMLTLYLASKYMVDFDTTHCSPLPSSFFKTPWTIRN